MLSPWPCCAPILSQEQLPSASLAARKGNKPTAGAGASPGSCASHRHPLLCLLPVAIMWSLIMRLLSNNVHTAQCQRHEKGDAFCCSPLHTKRGKRAGESLIPVPCVLLPLSQLDHVARVVQLALMGFICSFWVTLLEAACFGKQHGPSPSSWPSGQSHSLLLWNGKLCVRKLSIVPSQQNCSQPAELFPWTHCTLLVAGLLGTYRSLAERKHCFKGHSAT